MAQTQAQAQALAKEYQTFNRPSLTGPVETVWDLGLHLQRTGTLTDLHVNRKNPPPSSK